MFPSDQIQELQSPVGVFLGDRNDQPQVGLYQLALGVLRFAPAATDAADQNHEVVPFLAAGFFK